MKKILIAIILVSSSVFSMAQVEVGIQVSPSYSFNRVYTDVDSLNLTAGSGGMRFSAGPIFDIFINDNFAIGLGLWYSSKKSALDFKLTDTSSTNKVAVNLQYLQAPVAFKFFTNDIADKLRIYFALGGTLDFRIAQKFADDKDKNLYDAEKFSKIFDTGLLIGTGVEIKVGESRLIAGLNYNRGLINSLTKDFNAIVNKKTAKLNNDQISLMVGFKF